MTSSNDHDTLPPSMDPAAGGAIDPPTDFWGIVKRLGPGLIIAGSIVGSGELIATTKTGAQAGISLLWLIIIGCLIKVFAQIELGRYAISHGETTLSALDRIPGLFMAVGWNDREGHRSKWKIGANWILWFWGILMLCTVGQLGAIVGGVGQSLAITFPITGDYADAIRVPSESEFRRFVGWEDDFAAGGARLAALSELRQVRVGRAQDKVRERIDNIGERGETIIRKIRTNQPLVDDAGVSLVEPPHYDDMIWGAVVAVGTAALLFHGRYLLIQNVSLVLVVMFTFITIGNVVSLQMKEEFALPLSEFLHGLSFSIPDDSEGTNPLMTALATFGIIGVGASELIAYPYWCLEKGYAKFAGPGNTNDPNWTARARGWMRVMHYDAFASMVVYTIATLAFYIMGVAVLYKDGLDPDGMRMVSTLAESYVPVFGDYAKWLFLAGAIAVLYSTFLVANAGNARMVTDGLKVFGVLDRHSERTHERAVSTLSVVLPLLCIFVYVVYPHPVKLILVAGTMQFAMLPILGLASLYFRYKLSDPRLRPGLLWDVMLLISCLGLLIAGAYGIYSSLV